MVDISDKERGIDPKSRFVEGKRSSQSEALEIKTPPTQVIPFAKRPRPEGVEDDDALAILSAREAADWYGRLALFIRSKVPKSLAAKMLLHWLDTAPNKADPLMIDPSYVKDRPFVKEYLEGKVRSVLLTEKKAKFQGGTVEKWVGILPRIKDPNWDGKSKFKIHYEGGSVTMPMLIHTKAMLGMIDEDTDLFMALHKFGIQTDVVMSASPIPGTTKFNVTFDSWDSHLFDTYDWKGAKQKYLKVPNPDYGKPGLLRPDEKRVVVYHYNAKRVEDAGHARPYEVLSPPWRVTDEQIIGPAIVDSARTI